MFLLGQEVDGLAYVFARAICLISHFPHGLGVVRLELEGMRYCSGGMTLTYCFVRFARASVVVLCCSCFAVHYIRFYFSSC